MYSLDDIRKVDPQIAELIVAEEKRQDSHIELIASENWVSKAVMAAMGSVLTNKYAEGYPGKRYYGGCECVDEVEQLAIDRAKEIFGCTYANVQPHSGAKDPGEPGEPEGAVQPGLTLRPQEGSQRPQQRRLVVLLPVPDPEQPRGRAQQRRVQVPRQCRRHRLPGGRHVLCGRCGKSGCANAAER